MCQIVVLSLNEVKWWRGPSELVLYEFDWSTGVDHRSSLIWSEPKYLDIK